MGGFGLRNYEDLDCVREIDALSGSDSCEEGEVVVKSREEEIVFIVFVVVAVLLMFIF